MPSPFMDAFRTAHANATKEFDQFYGYISQAVTPRLSQQQSSIHTIHKTIPQTPKRMRIKLDGQHSDKNTWPLTPIIGRRSQSTEKMTPYQNRNARYKKSSTSLHHCQQLKQNHPPPRPITNTPNTLRTCLALDSDQPNSGLLLPQQDKDLNVRKTNNYRHSPYHSPITTTHKHSFTSSNTTPSRILYSTPIKNATALDSDASSSLCPSSPGVILQDHLQEESRRLEKLQHDILIVQQQSLALSHFGSPSPLCVQRLFTTDHIISNTDSYLPPSLLPRQHSYITSTEPLHHIKEFAHSLGTITSPEHHATQISLTDLTTLPGPQTGKPVSSPPLAPTPPPAFTTSTPLGSPSAIYEPPERQQHLLFSAPSSHLLASSVPTLKTSPRNTSITQPHLIHSSNLTPPFSQPPYIYQHRQLQEEAMCDIHGNTPKEQLQPCKIVTMPNGRRTNNKFWEEISGPENKSSSQQHYLVNTTASYITSASTSKKRKLGKQQPQAHDKDEDDMYCVSAENELNQGPEEPLQRHVKTLDQELGMAKDKHDTLQQQQHQQQIESKTFSLRPYQHFGTPFILDDDDDTDPQHCVTIDGDRWTFAGQHYTVDEKR